MNQTYTVDEIIEAFSVFDGTYRRDHVDAALAMPAEITPRLIGLLEMVRNDPARYANDDEFVGHLYAMMLLSYFGESRAHHVIVDLFRLPTELVGDLFDDMITEDLPMILHRTCGGSLEPIISLVQDRKADDYCRASAARAMTYAVVEGVVPREAVLEFFGSLFNEDQADPDSAFLGLLVSSANDLYPKELIDVIKRAFDNDLIDTFIIGYENIEATLEGSPDVGLTRLRQEMQQNMPADFHRSMSWWAMFEKEPLRVTKARKPVTPAAPPALSFVPSNQVAAKLTRQQRRRQEREWNKSAR